MIALCRTRERQHFQRKTQEAWHTFYQRGPEDPFANGFGKLEILNENSLPPGTAIPPDPQHDAEILTYVRRGALAHEDSIGGSGVVSTGEFQRMTAGRGIRHRERNASRTEWAHVFQIWLYPSQAGREPSREQRRFPAADCHGVFCVVASPDGRKNSLRLQEDALIFKAMLEPGQHVVHELAPGRVAWLHVVTGEAALGEVVLTAGDGAGISGERAVSLTARQMAEVLLLDLGRSDHAFSPIEAIA